MTVLAITWPRPPCVAQTLTDSCWAAVLQSWSRASSRMPNQQQAALIARYGEGPTGGITPWTKIPPIAAQLHLQWGGFTPAGALTYIGEWLASSYLFCAYRVGPYTHSVLVHGYDSEAGELRIMDPDGGRHLVRPTSWLTSRPGAIVMMRR